MTVVTISASYGAGGSRIGPRLAERLGVEFLDRVIPTAVADRLAVPLDDALAHDEPARRPRATALRFAPPREPLGGDGPPELVGERSFREHRDVIRETLAEGRA